MIFFFNGYGYGFMKSKKEIITMRLKSLDSNIEDIGTIVLVTSIFQVIIGQIEGTFSAETGIIGRIRNEFDVT